MKNQLIQIYLFVCQIYDTNKDTCFQRSSNNQVPLFTDQELLTIWFFAYLIGCFEKKKMHELIKNDWIEWFAQLPAYQTVVFRLNQLEQSFQTFGCVLLNLLAAKQTPGLDCIADSLPVMLATHRHSYSARVARSGGRCGLLRCQENAVSRRAAALFGTKDERDVCPRRLRFG